MSHFPDAPDFQHLNTGTSTLESYIHALKSAGPKRNLYTPALSAVTAAPLRSQRVVLLSDWDPAFGNQQDPLTPTRLPFLAPCEDESCTLFHAGRSARWTSRAGLPDRQWAAHSALVDDAQPEGPRNLDAAREECLNALPAVDSRSHPEKARALSQAARGRDVCALLVQACKATRVPYRHPPPPPGAAECAPRDLAERTVALLLPRGGLCTATQLSDAWLLTAAHCAHAVEARWGQHLARPQTRRSIRARVRHPNLDVALLEIDGPVKSTGARIEIASPNRESAPRWTAMGFGARDQHGVTRMGARHAIELHSHAMRCNDRVGCHDKHEMWLSAIAGQDTCRGDSGGGLFAPLLRRMHGAARSESARTCTWHLLGVTSRSVQSARRTCGSGGIYVKTQPLKAWIHQTTGDDS